MPWNLPDGKKPSFPEKEDGSRKNESAVQRASSWLSLLNCFEGGQFRPLRFSVMLAVVLLLLQVVHEQLQPPSAPSATPPAAEKPVGEKP